MIWATIIQNHKISMREKKFQRWMVNNNRKRKKQVNFLHFFFLQSVSIFVIII